MSNKDFSVPRNKSRAPGRTPCRPTDFIGRPIGSGPLNRRATSVGPSAANPSPKLDPRPAKNPEYIHSCALRVEDFIRSIAPGAVLSPKAFASPTVKDFEVIWETLFHAFDAKWCKKSKGKKIEEVVPFVLKSLGYSIAVSKSALSAPGSTHSWPQIILALDWFVTTIEINNSTSDMIQTDSGQDLMQFEEDGMLDLAKTFDWLCESYAKYMDFDDEGCSEVDSALIMKIQQDQEQQKEYNAKLRCEVERVSTQVTSLQQKPCPLLEVKREIEAMEQDEVSFQTEIKQLDEVISRLQKKSAEYEVSINMKKQETQTIIKQIEEILERVSKQTVTKEDISRLMNEKQKVDQMLENTITHKNSVEQEVNNKEIQLDSLLNGLERIIHEYNNKMNETIPMRSVNDAMDEAFSDVTDKRFLHFTKKAQDKARLFSHPQLSAECERPSYGASYTCPSDAPTSSTCDCGKRSGSLTETMEAWIQKQLKSINNDPSRGCPLHIDPPIVDLSKRPCREAYTLRRLYLWRPDVQFQLPTSMMKCPKCSKSCLCFHDWTKTRIVHGISEDSFAVFARYRCSKASGGCGNVFSSHTGDGVFGSEIHLQCPVYVTHRSSYTMELVDLLYEIVVGKSSPSALVEILHKNRTSKYLRLRALYYHHCSLWTSSHFNKDDTFADFGAFDSHCYGYNSTTGPSLRGLVDVFCEIMEGMHDLYCQTIGGVSSNVYCADHSHFAFRSIRTLDDTTMKRESSFDGAHVIMTSRGQVASLILTNSTSSGERLCQSYELGKRCVALDIQNPVMYQDRCCQDLTWLAGWYNIFGRVDVRLDNAHLLARYSDTLLKSNAKKKSILMSRLASELVGDSKQRQDQRNGTEVYEEFSRILKEFDAREEELGISPQQRTITTATWKIHKDQKMHFLSCIRGLGEDYLEIDRFGKDIHKRSTAGLENFFRHTRRIMPEISGKELGLATLLAHVVDWNLKREIQYVESWDYFLVSAKELALSQCLLEAPGCVRRSQRAGIGAISMGNVEEIQNVFGLSVKYSQVPSLDECNLEQDYNRRLEAGVFGLLEQVASMEALQDHDLEEICQATVTGIPAGGEAIVNTTDGDDGPTNVSTKQRSGRKRRIREGGINKHFTRKGDRRQKKTPSKRRKRSFLRRTKLESNSNEETAFIVTVNFNPFERRLLRLLVQSLGRNDGIEWTEYEDYKVVSRVWETFVMTVNSKIGKQKGWNHWIRAKSPNNLKEEVQRMVVVENYNLNVQKGIKLNGLISAIIKSTEGFNEDGSSEANVEAQLLPDTNEAISTQKIAEVNFEANELQVTEIQTSQSCLGYELLDKTLLSAFTGRTGRVNWAGRRGVFSHWRELHQAITDEECIALKRHFEYQRSKCTRNRDVNKISQGAAHVEMEVIDSIPDPVEDSSSKSDLAPVVESIQAPVVESIQAPVVESIQALVVDTVHTPVVESIQALVVDTVQTPVVESIQALVVDTVQTPVVESIQAAIVELNSDLDCTYCKDSDDLENPPKGCKLTIDEKALYRKLLQDKFLYKGTKKNYIDWKRFSIRFVQLGSFAVTNARRNQKQIPQIYLRQLETLKDHKKTID